MSRASIVAWTKRVGVTGVVFFAVKGLLWLTLPTLLAFARC